MNIAGLNKRIFRALFSSQYALMLDYRAEIFLWILSSILPFIMLSVWSNSEISSSIGFDNASLSRYFLSVFLVRQFSIVWVVKAFEADALLGRISPFILQPLHPLWRYFVTHLSEQFARLPFVTCIVFFFFIVNPSSFWIPQLNQFLLACLATWLAFIIGFLIQSIICALCFWTEKASGLERAIGGPFLFLSGLLAPITAFPNIVQKITYLTPFPYMIFFPAQILSGQEEYIFQGFLVQLLWIIILLPILVMLWKAGIRNYTGMGA